jgi:type III secretion protein Q
MSSLSLPRLSASEAQAFNAIARGLDELSIPGPGESGTALMALVAQSPDAPQPDLIDPVALHIEWSGAQFVLQLPKRALDFWVAEALGSDLAALPPAWQEAALAQSCQWLCDALSDLGRGRAAVIGTLAEGAGVPNTRHRLTVRLMWPETGTVILGVLHTDTLGLLVCASLIPERAPAPDQAAMAADLPAPLRLCIGETLLSLARLSSIHAGDVILITQPYLDASGSLSLLYTVPGGQRSLQISAQLEANLLTITSSATFGSDLSMAEHDSESEERISLDQLPIRLSFDVGTKTLTLAEIQSLTPGSTFTVDRPAQDYLTIRANGAVIGTGQLVEIDGRLGVSVTSLTPKSDRP